MMLDDRLAALARLRTPVKVQDFLDTLAINHEKDGETCMSPLRVLETGKAHCLEGAMLAAAALWARGSRPLLMNLKAAPGDDDHALALYRVDGRWGAISKTNHATLRFRDPVYATLRELALSYFHEYFVNATGTKTLRAYSRPLDLRRFGKSWTTAPDNLWNIAHALRDAPHHALLLPTTRRRLRPADSVERQAGEIIEWPKDNPRT